MQLARLGLTRTAGPPSLALLGLQVNDEARARATSHHPANAGNDAPGPKAERPELCSAPTPFARLLSMLARVIPAQLRPAHTPPPAFTWRELFRFVARRPRGGINRTGYRSLARPFP